MEVITMSLIPLAQIAKIDQFGNDFGIVCGILVVAAAFVVLGDLATMIPDLIRTIRIHKM